MADDFREYRSLGNSTDAITTGGEWAMTGWKDFGGTWHDIDKGEPLPDDPHDVNAFTFHYVSDAGDDVYYTPVDPAGFEDWDAIADAIADTLDRYGILAG